MVSVPFCWLLSYPLTALPGGVLLLRHCFGGMGPVLISGTVEVYKGVTPSPSHFEAHQPAHSHPIKTVALVAAVLCGGFEL
jgi:hypothetical protein